ncbi:MAG: metallophosphatase [Bacteroidota bacterium]
MKRRHFLKKAGGAAFLLSSGGFPFEAIGTAEVVKLCILHTNDVHSRIEPFKEDGGKRAGLGGAARRASLIRQVRAEEEHVLLLDSGDMFQGTPYFNYFGGELEFKLMSAMQYDAATIGNHDFDAGLEGLHKQLPHANFSLLSCNYDFSDTLMNGKIRPYQIFDKGGIRIGVFGLGIELEGLVPTELYGATRYLDPVKNANRVARELKKVQRCDYVICLSHLGYQYRSETISDVRLAKASTDIDLILGGHTHTFLEEPHVEQNAEGRPVIINQVGWAGIMLGRLDIQFERNRKNRCVSCANIWVKN